MKKLPVGIQNFEKLRKENFLYVDKTKTIHHLITEGGYYFFSRPRRFGKSLLVSTLKEIFTANKPLFKDLWIEDQWDWENKNPVVHIPFSSIGYKDLGLEQALHRHLDSIIKEKRLEIEETSLSQKFEKLLQALANDEGPVALLIDEYDKPIIDFLGEEIEQAKNNQKVLKNFYSVIKDCDPYLRMVFITGVSRFSHVSIFSDLNNLNDITLHPGFTTMLGYTEEELEKYFDEHLSLLQQKTGKTRNQLLDDIKTWYNGYSWDAQNFVYNPFSILLLFNSFRFANYWFKTATPTFLIELAKQKMYKDLDGIRVSESAFDAFDLENIDLTAIFFQTGYLTIKAYDAKLDLYTLGYPNREVKKSILEYLIGAFSPIPTSEVRIHALQTIDYLRNENIPEFTNMLNTVLHSIPYYLYEDSERFYHLIIHLFFKYIGLDVHSEVNTSRGRADVIVALGNKIYCMEFKLDSSAKKAIQQILEKGYLDKYKNSHKECIAVGINFSTKEREINDLIIERFPS